MDINDKGVALKRTAIQPESEIQKLERNEIGIKSNLKGYEIKQYVDRAIYKLIQQNMRKITLKAIGNCNIIKEMHVRRYYQS